jgi:MoaA/NifB/PqqE/SkfB family radical SAM enzyme
VHTRSSQTVAAVSAAPTTALAWLGRTINRTIVLPIVVVFPTSRCNSRCVSCDWWKSTGENDLTLEEIDRLAESLRRAGTKLVVFSGGEPLLRTDVFLAAAMFIRRGIKLHLLTSGLALERNAPEIVRSFERVIVSLDGADEQSYADVRGVRGLAALERGVRSLQMLAPQVHVSARATLHRINFRELPKLIEKAREMRLRHISFLAADVLSGAFGRTDTEHVRSLLLSRTEIDEFRDVVERTIDVHAEAFASELVSESPARLRRLPQYYAAMLGEEPFPHRTCDAPWVSAVIEANGDVRPCFFHPVIGNVRKSPLGAIVGDRLRQFRSTLDVETDVRCERCVCALNVSWRHPPWN